MKQIFCLAFAVALHPVWGANLIVNGGFEDPVFSLSGSDFKSFPTISGWRPNGDETAVYLSRTGHGNSGIWPVGGAEGSNQFADIGNVPNTGIQQTIVLTQALISPQLTWYDATSNQIATGLITTSSYNVTILNVSNQIVASQAFGTLTNVWTQKTLTTLPTLGSGSYTLIFEPTSGFRQKDLLLDSVTLVPEPETAILLTLCSFLGFSRRR